MDSYIPTDRGVKTGVEAPVRAFDLLNLYDKIKEKNVISAVSFDSANHMIIFHVCPKIKRTGPKPQEIEIPVR